MRVATRANNFRSEHAVAGITNAPQVIVGCRGREARPACTAFEFRNGLEQRKASEPAGKEPLASLVEEHATEWRLLTMLQKQMAILLAEVRHKLLHLFPSGRGKIELQFDDVTHSWFSFDPDGFPRPSSHRLPSPKRRRR